MVRNNNPPVQSAFFKNVKTIAVVGLSDKPERYSYQVAEYLQRHRFRIVPINPAVVKVLGEKAYPDLLSIPKEIKLDIIDIFRRSELVLPHVKEAIQRGDAHTIWMQEGISNRKAEELARNNGLNIVSNFCLMKAHKSQDHKLN